MPQADLQPPLPRLQEVDVEASESAQARRVLGGRAKAVAHVLAFGLAAYALYWVIGIIEPQIYRVTFLLVALVLTFLDYPARRTSRKRITVVDWILIALTIPALAWPIADFSQFIYRAATPSAVDLVLGIVTVGLVLEAARRTVGWILPVTAMVFIAYGYFGAVLDSVGLSMFGHRGYPIDRMVGTLYMTLEGVFGVPLDVAATYIILFIIYGAVLEASGAGKFFVDWALAATKSGGAAGPGRTVAVAGYLLGCVSGSGVANTVMVGAVAWPMMRRARYQPDVAGAILAAAGIGAIMAPPAMGAAAFLIAEFLNIPILQVMMMAIIPAVLYYLSILLMVEADARRMHALPIEIEHGSLGRLTLRYGYHFISLIAIAALMIRGMTAFRAVFWSTVLAVGLSFIRPETALYPGRLLRALTSAGHGVLPVAATTAAAGIIVGIVTLTGLGLKVSGIVVELAGGSQFLTVIYAALAVWVLGLAVPVTASYIIAAVMIAPALTLVGVPDFAAHMFIFYYAVLSEVSPPTALSPFAAAALTGGNPFRTTMLAWKYTAPAFLVPLMFTLSDRGRGILLQAPIEDVLWVTVASVIAVTAIAAGAGGWIRAEANTLERTLAIAGGLLLFNAHNRTDAIAVVLLLITVAIHLERTRKVGERARPPV